MFGYMVADGTQLSKEDRREYRRYYCSLCDTLYEKYGNTGRKTLSYDLTFVMLFLNSLYRCKNESSTKNCPIHPLIAHQSLSTPYSAYCADMNMLLTYYKIKDDYTDTGKVKYLEKMKSMQSIVDGIEQRYPRQSAVTEKQLDIIGKIEKDNILDPDLGSDAFGKIMAEIFCPEDGENELTEKLHAFGYHMGRFIYLMDAVVDFREDLKNQNYNPLSMMDSSNFEPMLMMVGEQCDAIYKTFDFAYDKSILDNIFYDGIWSRYRLLKSRERIFK